jgi:hypothetical protein
VRDKPLNRYPDFKKTRQLLQLPRKNPFHMYRLLFQRSFALLCVCAAFVSRATVAAARLITTLPLLTLSIHHYLLCYTNRSYLFYPSLLYQLAKMLLSLHHCLPLFCCAVLSYPPAAKLRSCKPLTCFHAVQV